MEDKQIKCLLVDDEADFRELMNFWLKSKGFFVITAPEGKTAVELAKTEKPDIIFMDLNMPVMDGNEAIRRIREFNKEVPIIIISAYVDDKRAKDTLSYGISGIFYKGKDFQEGLSLLEAALRTHKSLRK